jgi:hypothetical protein
MKLNDAWGAEVSASGPLGEKKEEQHTTVFSYGHSLTPSSQQNSVTSLNCHSIT